MNIAIRNGRAFEERDRLNAFVYGPDWRVRVIPLWLRRVFEKELGSFSP